jgi:hypothetical protein
MVCKLTAKGYAVLGREPQGEATPRARKERDGGEDA